MDKAEAEERGGKQRDEAADPPPSAKGSIKPRIATRPQGAGQRLRLRNRKGVNGDGGGYVETLRGAAVEVIRGVGRAPPLEENADLPHFTPECAHLLLQ